MEIEQKPACRKRPYATRIPKVMTPLARKLCQHLIDNVDVTTKHIKINRHELLQKFGVSKTCMELNIRKLIQDQYMTKIKRGRYYVEYKVDVQKIRHKYGYRQTIDKLITSGQISMEQINKFKELYNQQKDKEDK